MTGLLDRHVEQLMRCEPIPEPAVKQLCLKAREILIEEGNVQQVDSPVTICGDIHGQFYDMLELFKVGGTCPSTNYLFMGDFVDRGYFSVETFLLLLCLKYMVSTMSVKENMDPQMYGGIVVSPSLTTVDQIRSIDRKQEVPHDGAMCDLLWSDPDDIKGWNISPRGAGFLFGGDITKKFAHDNDIDLIARAHQLAMEGFKMMFDRTIVTVWSAPNYCYRCGNVASILELNDQLQQEYKVFSHAPMVRVYALFRLNGLHQNISYELPPTHLLYGYHARLDTQRGLVILCKDLLLFEERLKSNAANLRRRKSRYQLFLVHLLLLILVLLSDVFLYTSFFVMPLNFLLKRLTPEYEPIIPHPYFTSGLLLIAVTTLILFFASGMYNEKIGYANRYVPHANRALRSFNLYLNVRTQPRRSIFNPLSYLFSSGRAEDSVVSTTQAAQVPRPSSPRRGQTIPNIPLTDNPRGNLIFSSRVEPAFREGYERYRTAFEKKREEQRRLSQRRNTWFPWPPWQLKRDSSSHVQKHVSPRIQLHPPGINNPPTPPRTPSLSRRSTPTPEGAMTMRSRRNRSYRSSKTPSDSVDETN
ncbi:hypothetical protein Clacol_008920 [Clathrus columnatus]|uniref:protein-serine/threonine phosphatase n=1 Tax=Clathrus columnatus TaxID=1419009 RepID=A0AAV5AJ38_9AGAM|nr:hypothetical protein Clacol_008920 [Clathrus columnatus]